MNKFFLKGIAAIVCLATLVILFSCGDDDDPVIIAVKNVALDRTAAELKPEGILTLVATITPENATNKNVAWSSSNETIATVDGSGAVKALAEGQAVITVKTVDGGSTATATITVKKEAVESKTVELEGELSADMTLRAADINILKGFVYVPEGVTLTIEPGTVIKGQKATMGSLIIERGGKIIANGTVDKPIVFTSDQPKGARTYGDWGGLILCGRAPVNSNDPQIEGGPRTHYGGDKADDNSGVLRYVRIEFAGYPFQPNKEINGLTMGGVGSGTTIEYIQISYCGDDSYEWFGGTVNARYLIAYKGWDDEFDTDNGYQGKLQFLLGIRDPKHADTSKSNGFESDNDAEGSGNNPQTAPVFSNVTLIGPSYGKSAGKTAEEIFYVTEDAANGAKGGQFQSAMHIRRNSSLKVYNSLFVGWPYGLFLDKANANAVVKNTILAGMWENFRNEASETYFNTSGLNNLLFASTNDILKADADYMSVVSEQINGADFSDAELADSFFQKVAFKGAFDGQEDWTAGWSNFDPIHTDY